MKTSAITTQIQEILKPLGFTRRKTVWNRRYGAFVDVIDTQTSKSGDAITINSGVLHSEVHRICWGTEPLPVIQEQLCTVRARVGQLLEGRDIWWQLNDRRASHDIAKMLTGHVLPFLEEMHSLEGMEQFLMTMRVTEQWYPPPIIYLAILKRELGDRVGACALLADLGKKPIGAWQARIAEIAARLACP